MTTDTPGAALLASFPRSEYNALRSPLPIGIGQRVTTRHDFLKQVPLFADIADADVNALAKDLVALRFRQGQAIFHQGDPGQVLYLIQTGQVRIFVTGDEGQETSVNICGPGDIFGELAVIDGLPRSASAVAMEATVMLTLSRELFREHMRRSPQLALNFLKTLSVRVRYSTRQMDSRTFLSVPRRLARKLLELAQTYGVAEPEGVRINTTLTQSDLASLIGATRESINKALGLLRRRGLVRMRHNSIIVVDPDALRELGS